MLPKILFVDDDTNTLETMGRILKNEPYDCVFEDSSEAALEQLKSGSEKVHVVVSDQHMPGIMGDVLVSMVRDKYPHIVCVILTGFASIDTAMNAINKGEVYRYLTKPINMNDLKLALSEALVFQKTISHLRPITDKLNLEAHLEHQLHELDDK